MFKYKESFFVEALIPTSANKVWELISLPGGLTRFHPFLKEHIATNWNGVGSKDKVIYYSGLSFEREAIKWMEGKGFDVRITKDGKQPITVSFEIIPIDNKSCILKNTMYADFMKNLPFPIRWVLIKFKLKPAFTKYLEKVHMGLVYLVETGKQVQENQFGYHPIFSQKH